MIIKMFLNADRDYRVDFSNMKNEFNMKIIENTVNISKNKRTILFCMKQENNDGNQQTIKISYNLFERIFIILKLCSLFLVE